MIPLTSLTVTVRGLDGRYQQEIIRLITANGKAKEDWAKQVCVALGQAGYTAAQQT